MLLQRAYSREPAFFCAPGTWLTAKLSGAPAWILVQDYELDAAFDLGLLKGKLLRRMVLLVQAALGWHVPAMLQDALRLLGA